MTTRLRAALLLVVLAALALLAPDSGLRAQAATWFRADFNTLGPQNLYNFANRYAQSDTTWTTDHRPTGGWNGTGGAHVSIKGCPPSGCPSEGGGHQMNVGWQTPPIGTPLGRAWRIGDQAFVRFRIKFDEGATFPVESFGAKFILWGQTRPPSGPNSRWIIHLFPAYENAGCTLGFNYSWMGWAPPASIWTTAPHWGLAANGFDNGAQAGFSSNVNIDWACNPAVLVHASNRTPALKPQNVGAAPVNGWYHLQFQAVSGENGQADFRSWANNNSQSTPSAEHLDMATGLGVTGWSEGAYVVGYWGTNYSSTQQIGFTIDDFEMGATFDPAWYPSGATPPPPPPPCTFTATPTQASTVAAGGTFPVAVAASAATCAWTATSAAPFFTVSPSSAIGSGQATVTVAANTSTTARSGAVVVAGQTVLVSQAGATPPPPPPPTEFKVCTESTIAGQTATAARPITCPPQD